MYVEWVRVLIFVYATAGIPDTILMSRRASAHASNGVCSPWCRHNLSILFRVIFFLPRGLCAPLIHSMLRRRDPVAVRQGPSPSSRSFIVDPRAAVRNTIWLSNYYTQRKSIGLFFFFFFFFCDDDDFRAPAPLGVLFMFAFLRSLKHRSFTDCKLTFLCDQLFFFWDNFVF